MLNPDALDELVENEIMEFYHQDTIQKNPHFSEAQQQATDARQKLEAEMLRRTRPGLLSLLLALIPKGATLEQAVERIHDRRSDIRQLMIEYEDAMARTELLTAEVAFTTGFKAGVVLQSRLREWAEQ